MGILRPGVLLMVVGVSILLSLASASQTTPTSDLDRARRTLQRAENGDGVPTEGLFELRLNGYEYHREVSVSATRIVVVIGAHMGGGLVAFDVPTGDFVASVPALRIGWFGAVDLDGDGHSELLTEQLDGFGTGVRWSRYHLYSLSGSGWKHLWSGLSYDLETNISRGPVDPEIEKEVAGFVRFEKAQGSTLLLHVVFDVVAGQYTQTALEMRAGEIHEVALPYSSDPEAERRDEEVPDAPERSSR